MAAYATCKQCYVYLTVIGIRYTLMTVIIIIILLHIRQLTAGAVLQLN